MSWDGTVYDQARRRATLIGTGCVILLGGVKVAFGAAITEGALPSTSLPMSAILTGGAVAIAASSWLFARRARQETARAAQDLDVVSQRLIVMENTIASLKESLRTRAAEPLAKTPAVPPVSAEINVEIGLLGGLMKDIAETLVTHERSIDALSFDLGDVRRQALTITAPVANAFTAEPYNGTAQLAAAAAIAKPAPKMSPAAPLALATPKPLVASANAVSGSAISAKVPARMPEATLAKVPVAKAPTPSTPTPRAQVAAANPSSGAGLPSSGGGVNFAAVPQQAMPASAPDVSPQRREPRFTPLGATDQPHAAKTRVEAVSQRVEDVAAAIIDEARETAILAAAAEGRIELHLQSAVALPQRRVRFYETLSRLRLKDGSLLSPAEFLPVLERRGLSAEFDEKAFARVVQVARHLAARDGETGVSFNLCSASIAEPGFLRSLERVLARNPDVAPRILLEIPQRVLRNLDLDRMGGLSALVAHGIKLCVDRATDLRIDAVSLADRGVRFMKLPVNLLLGADSVRADIHVADMAALLARSGVVLIAEKVETEEQVRDLLDLDVPMAQGFLFSVPRPVRSDVLGSSGNSASEPPPHRTDSVQDEMSERKPFRAFLRRAGP
jgi:cyclic-di-GMP phosphodiesterase, flagellum assembly factor TipF